MRRPRTRLEFRPTTSEQAGLPSAASNCFENSINLNLFERSWRSKPSRASLQIVYLGFRDAVLFADGTRRRSGIKEYQIAVKIGLGGVCDPNIKYACTIERSSDLPFW